MVLVLDSEKIKRCGTLYVSPEQWLAHDIWTSVMDKLYFGPFCTVVGLDSIYLTSEYRP
jgi:hypothetical protein